MEKDEREILIGKHTFCLGEDNILYITIVENTDKENPNIMFDAITKLLDMAPGKVNVLVDINKANKPSVKIRNLIATFLSGKKVGKVAHFGLTPVARVLVAFSVGAIRKRNIKFFNTKESALGWLKK